MDKNYAPTPKTREIEMPLIKKAFEIIASKVAFSTVPGNHDYDAQWTDSRFPPKLTGPLAPDTAGVLHVGGLDNFRAVFGADTPFFKDKPWYVRVV
jgi:hypothetical protein